MGDPGRRAAALRQADCTIHQRLSARGRRLRGCGAARLQGGRRLGGLSEGTTRSLPARPSDNESARGRDAANLRDGRSLAARSRTAPLALLNEALLARRARRNPTPLAKEGAKPGSMTNRNIAMDMKPPSVATIAGDAEVRFVARINGRAVSPPQRHLREANVLRPAKLQHAVQ